MTLPFSQLLAHRAQRAFLELQDFGESHVTDFESFMHVYQPIMAKELGLPPTQNMMLNVRLNPFSSAHTRLLVNVSATNWYDLLCSDLGATALTTRLGASLKDMSAKDLYAVDSILVQYAKPLDLPVDMRFKPLEAPIQYSLHRSDLSKVWFEEAVHKMAYTIGDTIYTKIPAIVNPTNQAMTPDDMAWQYVTSLANNKKEMQNLFNQVLEAMGPVTSDVAVAPELRNELMGYVYQGFVQSLVKNESNIRYAFLKDSIQVIKEHMATLPPPTAAPITANPAIVNADLFSDSVALASTSTISTQTTDGAMSIEAWRDIKRKAKAKASSLKGKVTKKYKGQKIKKAEKKLDRADRKKSFTEEQSRRDAERALAKSQKKAEKASGKAQKSLTKRQQELEAYRVKKAEQAELTKRKWADKKKGLEIYDVPPPKSKIPLRPIAPTEAPPPPPLLPPPDDQVYDQHAVGTFIGNLILSECDSSKSLQIVMRIANGLHKRKTTTTHTHTHKVKREEEEVCDCKDGSCSCSKKHIVVMVTPAPVPEEQAAKLPEAKPIPKLLPAPAPKEEEEAKTVPAVAQNRLPATSVIPGMPTMTAVQTILNPVSAEVTTQASPIKSLSKVEFRAKYGNSHHLASTYLMDLSASQLKAGEYYLYSNKDLEGAADIGTIKRSFKEIPISRFTNPIVSTVVVSELGRDKIFHVLK